MRRHLTSEHHDRHRIHVGIHQRRHDVGHAWTGSHERDAHLAGGFRIAFGHMACTLFVARENYLNILLLMKDIEDFQDDAAGESKESLHPFALQTFQKDFGSRELHSQLLFAVRFVLLLLF